MGTLWQDARYALRLLTRDPGFAAIAALTLALGIGANTAIFSIVHAVVLRPLAFRDPSRIVLVWGTSVNRSLKRGTSPPADFLDWKEQSDAFEQMAGWRAWFYNLTGGGEPEQVLGATASANFFNLLGVQPLLGRSFLPEEETSGRNQVVILSYRLWSRRYGADPSLIGKSILVDDKPSTVVGVLPPDFSLFSTSQELDLWSPLSFEPSQIRRDNPSLIVFARLKPEVPLQKAQAEMTAIAARLQQAYPTTNKGVGVWVVRFQEELSSRIRPALLILFAAVAFVLLIACANVANLLLSRAAGRQKEIAVRASQGASHWRLVRQLITESLLLAFLGGALGVLLAYWGLRFLPLLLPAVGSPLELPRVREIRLDPAVFAFTLSISFLAGIFFGTLPAFQTVWADLNETLKEGGRASAQGRRGRWLRSLLVVSEISLSLVLLIGAGLLIRSFANLVGENLGFDPENLLTMQVLLPESRYPESRSVAAFYQQVLERVRALPGVTSASAINFLPLSRWTDYCDFEIEGRPVPPADQPFAAQYRVVDADYLHTMRIQLEKGRDLQPGDSENAPGVVLINDVLARAFWPNADPVGQHIRLRFSASRTALQPHAKDSWLTIAGVLADVRERETQEDKVGQIYLPYLQNPSQLMRLVVRTSSNPAGFAAAVRHAIFQVDKNQTVTETKTMDEFLAASLAQRRLSMLLLAIFASLATLLAIIGIYGVMSYAVTQRAHEFGVRMALGAQPNHILKLVVKEGMILALIGLAIGLAAAWGLTRLLASLLYGVKTADPITFAGVAFLLAAAALAACYLPARRATKVDPIIALRYE